MQKVISVRITGTRHRQAGEPCEDAILHRKIGQDQILAVADGVSDHRCPFARYGSMLATKTAAEIWTDMLKLYPKSGARHTFFAEHREEIFRDFVTRWTESVVEDFFNRSADEAPQAGEAVLRYVREDLFPPKHLEGDIRGYYAGISRQRDLVEQISLLYSTTVHTILVTDAYCYYMSLGDGDIACYNNGRVEFLIEEAPRNVVSPPHLGRRVSELRSLFQMGCVRITHRGIDLGDHDSFLPVFYAVSTDGFRNAYHCDAQYLDRLEYWAERIKKGETERLQKGMRRYLTDLMNNSRKQDDLSLCMLIDLGTYSPILYI